MALRNGFLWVASLGSGSGAGRPGDKLPDLDMTISPAEIADLCMERRIKLLLIPEVIAAEVLNRRPGQSDHLNGQYHEIFRETARKHRGVISVPINHRYDARQTASYFIDDVHMNDLGYGYLAKIIADVIFDAGLLAQKPVKASGAEVRTTNRLGAGPGEPASGK